MQHAVGCATDQARLIWQVLLKMALLHVAVLGDCLTCMCISRSESSGLIVAEYVPGAVSHLRKQALVSFYRRCTAHA